MTEKIEKNKGVIVIVFLFLISYFTIYSLNYLGESFSQIPFIGTAFPGYNWSFDAASFSPMFALMPALGFAFVFFMSKWAKKELDWGFMETVPFLIVFVLFCILAFYFTLFFFYLPQSWNLTRQGGTLTTCFYYSGTVEPVNENESPAQAIGRVHSEESGRCMWNNCFNCSSFETTTDSQTAQGYMCQLNYFNCFGKSAFFMFFLGGLFGWISIKLSALIESRIL